MANIVFYATNGDIIAACQMSGENAAADGRPFIQVDQYRPDYDSTHRVEGGRLVARAVPLNAIVVDEASVLAQLDRDRERAQMTVLTDGGAKKYVYNRKAVEVIDSRGLTVAVLNALSLTDKQKRYPFAYAETLATGETLSVVLARFEAGLTASSAKIAIIEAQAQKAKRAVRAAPTIAAKQAAAQVNWSV